MKILTNESMVEALRAAGIPNKVAENVALVYPVTDIRRIVQESDYARLKEIVGVGSKRAETIVSTLIGNIPDVLSMPCPDVKIPNVKMHDVNELTLCMSDGKPTLKRTSVIRKRYGPALQKLQKLSGEENVTFTTVSVIDTKDAQDEYQLKKYWSNAVMSPGLSALSAKRLVLKPVEFMRCGILLPQIGCGILRMSLPCHGFLAMPMLPLPTKSTAMLIRRA